MSKQHKQPNEKKYGAVKEELMLKLSELQRKAKDKKIPMVIVFEGGGASDKSSLINELIITLDPRNVKVYNATEANEEEDMRPFMWSFWNEIPKYGSTAIFYKSWYSRIISKSIKFGYDEDKFKDYYKFINNFEKQLIDDGYLVIKFLLNIDKKIYKKRIKEIKKNPLTIWKVKKSKEGKYKKYKEVAHRIVGKTNTEYCQWNIVDSRDKRDITISILKTITVSLEKKINHTDKNTNKVKETNLQENTITLDILSQLDISKTLKKDEANKKIKECEKKLRKLQHELYKKRISLVVVYEGWDAAGKGGNIKKLIRQLDPRRYEVFATAKPSDVEKVHHYLWRFWTHMPQIGHIAIFDRSWYGRVLVERIEGFCTPEEWKRAYNEINEMEEQLVHSNTIVIKFWLDIDKEEQLKRFQERQQDSNKQWKITEEDWRNRYKWELYKEAINEMLYKTNTSYAPWIILKANCKQYARVKTLSKIVEITESVLQEYK